MTLDEFLPQVLLELPGCPHPTVAIQTGNVLDEFCRRTLCWSERLDSVILIAGLATYDLDAVAGGNIHIVNSVTCNGQALAHTTTSELHREFPGWRGESTTTPTHFIVLNTGEIQVYPVPNESGAALDIEATMVPRLPATTLPDVVMRGNLQAIASGVRGRLMAMQGQAWTNTTGAGYYLKLFEDGVFDATAERMQGMGSRSLRVAPRRFGA